ncbi:serine/threonine protein kinase [bacterium]|nr:serine/threonine protein kinase [bacterium]MBP9807100.1 serine/threonine protein kinase [bacterium]
MPAPRPDTTEGESKTCSTCGKRVAVESKIGSLTGYFFQSFYCQCKSERTPRVGNVASAKDFCSKCGLTIGHSEQGGSISGFLFQDIRCKCDIEAGFDDNSMSTRFRLLKQTASAEDAAVSVFERTDLNADGESHLIGLKAGAIIGGNYRILRPIGRGGMGEVYLALHQRLDKRCALKVIPPDKVTKEAWQRFKQEAQVISKLNHQNIVQVSDLGIHAECLPYYAMEFVSGQSLADILNERKRMKLESVIEVFLQVCNGVEYAHKSGVIHRDLKPGNIMLTTDVSDRVVVKILDFGLAKLSQPGRLKQSLTLAGDVFGSPFYMSPEQCSGEVVDNRSDIYSAGCTMFECLTGQPPFDGNRAAAIIISHQGSPAPSLASVVGPGVFSDSMEIVMAKLLRKNPVERYQTMAELHDDLEKVQRGEEVLPFYVSRAAPAATIAKPTKPARIGATVSGDTMSAATGSGASTGARKYTFGAIVSVVVAVALVSLAAAMLNLPKANVASDKTGSEPVQSRAVPQPLAAASSRPIPAKLVDGCRMKLKWGAGDEPYNGLFTENHATITNDTVTYCFGSPHFGSMIGRNLEHKAYAKVLMKDWAAEIFLSNPMKIDKVEVGDEATICGIKCRHYLLTGHLLTEPSAKLSGDYWATKDIKVNPLLAADVCCFASAPIGYGLPVRLSYKLTREAGKSAAASHPRVQTISLCDLVEASRCQVNQDQFDLSLAGFSKVKGNLDLYTQDLVDGMNHSD